MEPRRGMAPRARLKTGAPRAIIINSKRRKWWPDAMLMPLSQSEKDVC
jgi:hypothetical protein